MQVARGGAGVAMAQEHLDGVQVYAALQQVGSLVDAPLESVVLGAGHCIESFDALKVMFME